jgi:imidazole glycerol-phosphate synthase subunit HisF
MLQTRIIPCLQLIDESLVKAVHFDKYGYIGDPCNTVRIFNELEVDELCFLDIRASREGRIPNFKILQEIADECFMPLSYGGGITTFEQAKKIFSIGFEKVILNTQAYRNIDLITQISRHFGVQAVVASIDFKKHGSIYSAYINDGKEKIKEDVLVYTKRLEKAGAGEILLTSMDREGTWGGFDIEFIKHITSNIQLPVIAHGGGGSVEHVNRAIKEGRASAVALGSLLVYQKKGMGVLVNFPETLKTELTKSIHL